MLATHSCHCRIPDILSPSQGQSLAFATSLSVTRERMRVGSEAPAETSSGLLTSYAVRLSPANTHSSSQLSPRNSGPSQPWSGGPENSRWQTGEFGLSSSPAQGACRAWRPFCLRCACSGPASQHQRPQRCRLAGLRFRPLTCTVSVRVTAAEASPAVSDLTCGMLSPCSIASPGLTVLLLQGLH